MKLGLLAVCGIVVFQSADARAIIRFQAEGHILSAVVKEYGAKALPLKQSKHCKVYQQSMPDLRFEFYEIGVPFSTARNKLPIIVKSINKYTKPKIIKFRALPDLHNSSSIVLQYGPSWLLDSAIFLLFEVGGKTELCLQKGA